MVGTAVLIAFVSVIYLVSTRSVEMVEDNAFKLAQSIAEQYGNEVKAELEVGMDTARTLAQTLKGIKDTDNPNREDVNCILKKILYDNPNFVGIWTAWEPNAFDGKDREYTYTLGHDSTGRFVPFWNLGQGYISVEPLVDYEVPGAGDYYQLAKNSKNESIVVISYNVAGKDILMTSLAVPIIYREKFVAVAGVNISLEEIQETVAKIKPYETGYASLISHDGLYVAHNDIEVLGKDIDNIEAKNAVFSGESYNYTQDGFYHIFVPINIGRATSPWSFEVSIPLKKVQNEANRIRNYAMVVAVFALLVIALVLYVITDGITKPILETTAVLKNISEGEGDLTKRLTINSKDEIGHMSEYFNRFIMDVQMMVRHIREKAEQVAFGAEEMSNSSEGAQKTVQQVGEAIQEMAKGASEQATKSQEASEMISEIAKAISSNDNRLEAISKGSEFSLTLVGDGLKALEEQNCKMEENMEATQNVAKAIDDLTGQIQEVSHILETISNIASQTNLLALNAAIEAARAGEHGRGFAVVAEEVRKLAEESAASAEEIGRIVQKVQSGAREAVTEMDFARNIVVSQREAADKTNEVFNKISAAVENMAGSIQEIAASSEEINTHSQNISEAIESIAAVAEENAASSEEISASSEEQNAVVEEIAVSAESLLQLGRELRHSIDRFKL